MDGRGSCLYILSYVYNHTIMYFQNIIIIPICFNSYDFTYNYKLNNDKTVNSCISIM